MKTIVLFFLLSLCCFLNSCKEKKTGRTYPRKTCSRKWQYRASPYNRNRKTGQKWSTALFFNCRLFWIQRISWQAMWKASKRRIRFQNNSLLWKFIFGKLYRLCYFKRSPRGIEYFKTRKWKRKHLDLSRQELRNILKRKLRASFRSVINSKCIK